MQAGKFRKFHRIPVIVLIIFVYLRSPEIDGTGGYMRKIAYQALLLLGATLSVISCGRDTGPSMTVVEFNKAVTRGDFTLATQLCDTLSMKDFLESYQQAWNTMVAEDSSVVEIARSLVEGTLIHIESEEKCPEGRQVTYTLEADGRRKSRTAVLKKEEGEWKIIRITDTK